MTRSFDAVWWIGGMVTGPLSYIRIRPQARSDRRKFPCRSLSSGWSRLTLRPLGFAIEKRHPKIFPLQFLEPVP